MNRVRRAMGQPVQRTAMKAAKLGAAVLRRNGGTEGNRGAIALESSTNIDPRSLLTSMDHYQITEERRIQMTLRCRDTDKLPKVDKAGSTGVDENTTTQVMHNGLRVVRGGYYGNWMAQIIEGLRGHHEPQEELVFHRILERIDTDCPTMLELGAFWAYYSLWFLSAFPGAIAVASEPDPDHRLVGQRNADLNALKPIFLSYATGLRSSTLSMESELHPGEYHEVPVRSIAEIMTETSLDRIDLLHMDIQGAELTALRNAEDLITSGCVRFAIVSTHHHSISGSASTHQDCLDWLAAQGAHIICEHTVAESFSGDGLIACSFSDDDASFKVDCSINRPSQSLFGAPEADLEALVRAIESPPR